MKMRFFSGILLLGSVLTWLAVMHLDHPVMAQSTPPALQDCSPSLIPRPPEPSDLVTSVRPDGSTGYVLRMDWATPPPMPPGQPYRHVGYRYAFSHGVSGSADEQVIGVWVNALNTSTQTSVEVPTTSESMHLTAGDNVITGYLRAVYVNTSTNSQCRTNYIADDTPVTFATSLSAVTGVTANQSATGETGNIPQCGLIQIRWNYTGTVPARWLIKFYSLTRDSHTKTLELDVNNADQVSKYGYRRNGTTYSVGTPECYFMAPEDYGDSDRAVVGVTAVNDAARSSEVRSGEFYITSPNKRADYGYVCSPRCRQDNNEALCNQRGGACTYLGNCPDNRPQVRDANGQPIWCGVVGGQDGGACCTSSSTRPVLNTPVPGEPVQCTQPCGGGAHVRAVIQQGYSGVRVVASTDIGPGAQCRISEGGRRICAPYGGDCTTGENGFCWINDSSNTMDYTDRPDTGINCFNASSPGTLSGVPYTLTASFVRNGQTIQCQVVHLAAQEITNGQRTDVIIRCPTPTPPVNTPPVGGGPSPTPRVPTSTPGGPTATPTLTPVPSITPSLTPTSTPRPSFTPTPTPTNTPTPTPTPTSTPIPTPTPTNTPSPSPTLTPTPTPVPTSGILCLRSQRPIDPPFWLHIDGYPTDSRAPQPLRGTINQLIDKNRELFDRIDVRGAVGYIEKCFRPWNSEALTKPPYKYPLSITRTSGPRLIEIWAQGSPGQEPVLMYQNRAFATWDQHVVITVADPLSATSIPTQPPLSEPGFQAQPQTESPIYDFLRRFPFLRGIFGR